MDRRERSFSRSQMKTRRCEQDGGKRGRSLKTEVKNTREMTAGSMKLSMPSDCTIDTITSK